MNEDTKVTSVVGNEEVFSAADILGGGDNNVRRVTVPGLLKNGRPGVVCHLPVSADAMIGWQEQVLTAQKIEAEGGNPHHVENMVNMLVSLLCNPDGSLMFTEDQLRKAPADDLVAIMRAITRGTSGNVLSGAEATGSASPTESQPS